jgi:prepilin-type N-terminal cleavage/methylation domain-containing protein
MITNLRSQFSSLKSRLRRGFTLIELMVVISITAALGVLGMAGFSSYNQVQVLQTSASGVVSMLNLAKSRAQSQVKPSGLCPGTSKLDGYVVKVIPGSNDTPGNYSLWLRCSGLDVRVDGQDRKLPSDLNFFSYTSLFFPVREGGTRTPDNIVICNSGGKARTITVNSLGGVSVQSSACSYSPVMTPMPTAPLTPSITPTLSPVCSDTWVQKANFPGGASTTSRTGFSIGNKGYIALGAPESKVWEYDPSSLANGKDANGNPKGIWMQNTTLAYAYVPSAGFSIGNKGYVQMGPDQCAFNGTGCNWTYRGFYEYDQPNNVWAKKAGFQANANLDLQVGFSIGNKGYIGTGWGFDGENNVTLKSFKEYDPDSNTWTAKTDIPIARGEAVGFSIDTDNDGIPDKGYIGTGGNGGAWCTGTKSDFWRYDPVSNTWANRAPFGGGKRERAVGFSIGNRGYIGTGSSYEPDGGGGYNCVYFDDFYEYNPDSNLWTPKANFPGGKTWNAVGFSIGNKGYILNMTSKALYEYCPTFIPPSPTPVPPSPTPGPLVLSLSRARTFPLDCGNCGWNVMLYDIKSQQLQQDARYGGAFTFINNTFEFNPGDEGFILYVRELTGSNATTIYGPYLLINQNTPTSGNHAWDNATGKLSGIPSVDMPNTANGCLLNGTINGCGFVLNASGSGYVGVCTISIINSQVADANDWCKYFKTISVFPFGGYANPTYPGAPPPITPTPPSGSINIKATMIQSGQNVSEWMKY